MASHRTHPPPPNADPQTENPGQRDGERQRARRQRGEGPGAATFFQVIGKVCGDYPSGPLSVGHAPDEDTQTPPDVSAVRTKQRCTSFDARTCTCLALLVKRHAVGRSTCRDALVPLPSPREVASPQSFPPPPKMPFRLRSRPRGYPQVAPPPTGMCVAGQHVEPKASRDADYDSLGPKSNFAWGTRMSALAPSASIWHFGHKV